MTATATTLPVWAAYSPATDTTELPAVLRDPAQFLPNRPARSGRARTLLLVLLFVVLAAAVATATARLMPGHQPAPRTFGFSTVETPAEPTGHGGIR